MTKTPEYLAWRNIKERCRNPGCRMYHRYGGRGIKVCDEWFESFMAFFREVGERPGPGYSIDRIDNEGNYEPGNVRWATRIEQQNNLSKCVPVEINGVTLGPPEWARISGLNKKTIVARVAVGVQGEAIIAPPKRRDPAMRGIDQTPSGKFYVRTRGRQPKAVGTFDTLEAAIEARDAAWGRWVPDTGHFRAAGPVEIPGPADYHERDASA